MTDRFTCKDCVFFGEKRQGAVCRRNPPASGGEVGFPTVEPTKDWCGELETRGMRDSGRHARESIIASLIGHGQVPRRITHPNASTSFK